MKKHLKRTLSVLLCAMLCCSTFALNVDAKTAKKYVKSISVAKKATVTIPANKKTVTKSYKVTVKVSGKASKTFKAKSSKKSVATVKVSGSKIKVTAKKAGKATITVTTKAKNKKGKKLSKKLTLTVKKAKAKAKKAKSTEKKTKSYVKAIGIESEDTIDIPAESKTFAKPYKVIVSVVGNASEKYTAKSSDTSVADVKVDGSYVNVTAKKAGKATITVTAKDKNAEGDIVNAKLALTVTKATAPVNRDGEITEKKVKWYQYENGTKEEENPLYFSSEYPDVPFVKDNFVIEHFLKNYMYTTGAEETKGEDGLSHTYKLPMGTSVRFDYDNQVLLFSDYTSTLALNGDYITFNPFGIGATKTGLIYRQSDKDRYYGGDPVYATFAYDEVPMLKDGDDILIPLQTYSDLFLSFTGQFFNYNGKGVFFVNNSIEQMAAADEGWKAYYDLYKDSVKTDTVSEAVAQVNYYELCNVLDARYGLQAAHNIASFDEYFTRMGFRERMLTTDLAEIEKAQRDISTSLFEDFHSGSGLQSVYLSEPIEYTPQYSPGFINRNHKMTNRSKARAEAMGTLGEDFSAYERVGDTVFITFDQFLMEETMTSYVSEGYEPQANPNDTIQLFAYALKQLQTKDKDAKNVVIDLACNSGGAIYSCAYAMQAICGQSQINIHNPNTWALHQTRTEWDLNFDGKYDENDKSMLEMGFNVAVNISDNSFSCGNLLPNELDELDDRILLIGQQSGGGACAVGYISTAISSTMQISSEQRFSTMKNGYIKDIDGGIAPDVYLTDKKLFDREYIDKLVSEQFGVKDYTEDKIPVLHDSLDSTETATLRVYDDQPDVPYMNVKDFYDQFYTVGTDLTEGMTCKKSGSTYTLTNIAGNKAKFNVDEETITTDNLEKFANTAHTLQVEMANVADSNYPFVKINSTSNPETTEPKTIGLDDYGIDLRGDDSGVYAPVPTLCDIFATAEDFYVVYSGEKLYTCDFTKALQPTAAIDSDPDFEAAVKADRTAEAADFYYRELCFNLDLWHGQPGQEFVHEDLQTMKFDQLLTKKYPEIKEMLLSSDYHTYMLGLSHLTVGLLFDGGHTAITSPFFVEILPELKESMQGKDYSARLFYEMGDKMDDEEMRTTARDAAYGDDYYIEQGDTAMIHFDSFVVNHEGWKAYYAGTGERPLKFMSLENGQEIERYDTVGTILSGLERAKQNPAIKNIVIDMSCNGGGDDFAMLSIEWLMTGKGYIRFENEFNGQIKTRAGVFDVNKDGKFDENDVSPYTDYNYAVLTSNASFSCGNAFPWFMHEHGAMILGQRSGGGACAIRMGSSRGIAFGCSSSSSRIVSDSGVSVDFGCPLDADLTTESENPYENFYDLGIFSTKMNEFFAAE